PEALVIILLSLNRIWYGKLNNNCPAKNPRRPNRIGKPIAAACRRDIIPARTLTAAECGRSSLCRESAPFDAAQDKLELAVLAC
ncbi:MAG: hypothetical protein ACYS7Y_24050, partial [Planctomycetota bacterium]